MIIIAHHHTPTWWVTCDSSHVYSLWISWQRVRNFVLLPCFSYAEVCFYRYYFGRCWSKLVQLVPICYSRKRFFFPSDRLHDFSATIPRYYKNICSNSFFPRTARLSNSLPTECFPLTYDLNGYKFRINRLLSSVDSF